MSEEKGGAWVLGVVHVVAPPSGTQDEDEENILCFFRVLVRQGQNSLQA